MINLTIFMFYKLSESFVIRLNIYAYLIQNTYVNILSSHMVHLFMWPALTEFHSPKENRY